MALRFAPRRSGAEPRGVWQHAAISGAMAWLFNSLTSSESLAHSLAHGNPQQAENALVKRECNESQEEAAALRGEVKRLENIDNIRSGVRLDQERQMKSQLSHIDALNDELSTAFQERGAERMAIQKQVAQLQEECEEESRSREAVIATLRYEIERLEAAHIEESIRICKLVLRNESNKRELQERIGLFEQIMLARDGGQDDGHRVEICVLVEQEDPLRKLGESLGFLTAPFRQQRASIDTLAAEASGHNVHLERLHDADVVVCLHCLVLQEGHRLERFVNGAALTELQMRLEEDAHEVGRDRQSTKCSSALCTTHSLSTGITAGSLPYPACVAFNSARQDLLALQTEQKSLRSGSQQMRVGLASSPPKSCVGFLDLPARVRLRIEKGFQKSELHSQTVQDRKDRLWSTPPMIAISAPPMIALSSMLTKRAPYEPLFVDSSTSHCHPIAHGGDSIVRSQVYEAPPQEPYQMGLEDGNLPLRKGPIHAYPPSLLFRRQQTRLANAFSYSCVGSPGALRTKSHCSYCELSANPLEVSDSENDILDALRNVHEPSLVLQKPPNVYHRAAVWTTSISPTAVRDPFTSSSSSTHRESYIESTSSPVPSFSLAHTHLPCRAPTQAEGIYHPVEASVGNAVHPRHTGVRFSRADPAKLDSALPMTAPSHAAGGSPTNMVPLWYHAPISKPNIGIFCPKTAEALSACSGLVRTLQDTLGFAQLAASTSNKSALHWSGEATSTTSPPGAIGGEKQVLVASFTSIAKGRAKKTSRPHKKARGVQDSLRCLLTRPSAPKMQVDIFDSF